MINVCDIQVMKPLLAEHGFHFSKAKGQNFLIASWVPASIAQESGVDEHTGVLEIGPGIGPLTQQLGLRAAKVCAVEVDTRLAPILDKTVGELPNVEILWRDVLKQDIPALVAEKFPGLRPMACANLPYYITTPILSALLEADCFDAVTVMVQKEVAQRIAADPAFGLTREEIVAGLVPENFVGRAPQQVEEFIANVLQPIFDADPEDVEQHASLSV